MPQAAVAPETPANSGALTVAQTCLFDELSIEARWRPGRSQRR